jgi:hypothetical protein
MAVMRSVVRVEEPIPLRSCVVANLCGSQFIGNPAIGFASLITKGEIGNLDIKGQR